MEADINSEWSIVGGIKIASPVDDGASKLFFSVITQHYAQWQYVMNFLYSTSWNFYFSAFMRWQVGLFIKY